MNKLIKPIFAFLLTVIFFISCVSAMIEQSLFLKHVLQDNFGEYSYLLSISKYIISFIIIVVLTYILKEYKRVFTLYIPLCIIIVSAITYYDLLIGQHLLYNYSYVLWECSSVSVSCIAVFTGTTLFLKDDYKTHFKRLWLAYLIIYLLILYTCFIRKPDSFEFSVNMTPGNGTFKFFGYMITHLSDMYIILICIGNLLVFLPLPFIMKSISFRINDVIILITGLVFPILAETYQYIFKCGNVDIDDIILNLGGFIIGMILYRIIIKKKNLT